MRSARLWAALAGVSIALFTTQAQAQQHVANQALVQYTPGTNEADKARARATSGADRLERVADDLELISIPPGLTFADAQALVHAHAAVQWVEPNWIYQHFETSNDPYYTNGSLWGMYGDATAPANPYGSQAGEAWAAGHTGSSAVYVGVIDQGIQFTHSDLEANIWSNPFDAVDGLDNDGNGYADDVHGWDFVSNDNTIYDGKGKSGTDAHGTHVSGTIGAEGGNGLGVAGVSWHVTIISGKFLGKSGGTTANAVRAVDYMTDLKVRHGLNIVATNNSWGGGGYSQALADAISRANDANILFVAAAGNSSSNNDLDPSYPASYGLPNVIAVAAITSGGGLASFSSYGATSVDLGAPGSGITSTVPPNRYASYNGTSMATPHVTGAAALYAATHPGATAAHIKAAILASTIPTSSLNGKCVTGGRLNAGGF